MSMMITARYSQSSPPRLDITHRVTVYRLCRFDIGPFVWPVICTCVFLINHQVSVLIFVLSLNSVA